VADGFFEQVLKQARAQQLLSADHFTVDGTLIEAWRARKVFNARVARRRRRKTAAAIRR
jgi:transposase